MSELLNLIQEADRVAFDLETARANIEVAKQNLESAKDTFEQTKKSYEEMLSKADELGVPRPKIRKLMEERTMALVASGLIFADSPASALSKVVKVAKTPKSLKKKVAQEAGDDTSVFENAEESAALM